ncbi:2-hydroxychromene-2-carboxylate isomerase [uncultured Algimonas sp.]|uniref:2-hydroxychromene-2-carboxylate isomerase n=1 Tax=uncultured Algimonas sp. TaxID=1547920 RepID=UPI00261B5836|nr:2-hydroxychromene-2-carboxylate isomerase [uncultured Algimonas sp.]
MTTLDFYYDVGSPNVYLAWKALSQVDGLALDLKPVLIGGLFKSANNLPPWTAFSGVPAKMRYMMVEIDRFAELYGLSGFRMNPHFPVNTLLAMRTAMIAHEEGVADAFVPAVQAAMWETGRDIADPGILADVLDEAGLPGPEMVARTSEPAVKQSLADATQAAVDRGLFGLPSWFVQGGTDLYFGKENCWMFGAAPTGSLPHAPAS